MRVNLHSGNTHFSSYSFIHTVVAPNIIFVLVDAFFLKLLLLLFTLVLRFYSLLSPDLPFQSRSFI